MTWRLIQSIPLLAKESLFIHKWGETSRPALRKLRFVEEDTGLISETTDLQIKLNKSIQHRCFQPEERISLPCVSMIL